MSHFKKDSAARPLTTTKDGAARPLTKTTTGLGLVLIQLVRGK